MTDLDFDPDLERLGDALRASAAIDLAREEHDALAAFAGTGRSADGVSATRRTRRLPRVFAGGTLGLAGVGAALVLALGGSAAPPAFAVTRQHDGSVLVTVNVSESTQPWVLGADRKLAAMGIDEQIMISTEPGAATVSGPVSCTPMTGVDTPQGPPVKVLLGTDGTQVIPAGTTGAGTVHLSGCQYFKSVSFHGLGNTGNTGTS